MCNVIEVLCHYEHDAQRNHLISELCEIMRNHLCLYYIGNIKRKLYKSYNETDSVTPVERYMIIRMVQIYHCF